MLRSIFLVAALFSTNLAYSNELNQPTVIALDDQSEFEDVIFVPFQGTWVEGANTFVFTAGDTRNGNWVEGNQVGGGGQVNRYLWSPSTTSSGTFYFDTAQGRQGPIQATLSNNNRTMVWRFGAESITLRRVN